MKYQSTRGKVRDLSFEDVLFSGYAADGGLFMPITIPKLDNKTLQDWIDEKLSYPKVVAKVVRLFVSQEEIPDDILYSCIDKAYSKFQIPEVVGITKCKNEAGESFEVAELFHGPTASFKDYALSLIGRLMEYFLSKKNENTIILVGTSGDTGSAAIRSVEGLVGMDIIVLYPEGKISPVQEAQMNASMERNVHVFAVEGTSDDLDVPIKQCFPRDGLCSINSINWARIMIQISHYVYLYLQEGEELDIFVPTGAAGNVASGVLASRMGIPIKLFVATNENKNVDAFLNKGQLQMGGYVIPTPANAMDIGSPYNLERVIYLLSESSDITASYMTQSESSSNKSVQISDELLEKIKKVIRGCRRISADEIYETMRKVWKLNNYMACPHTATAITYYNKNRASRNSSNNKTFIISTASPQKFPEVAENCGIPVDEWNGHKLLDSLKSGHSVKPDTSMTRGADWLKILQQKISEIQKVRACACECK